jgi:DNA-binding NarL/FixJ family response regulator
MCEQTIPFERNSGYRRSEAGSGMRIEDLPPRARQVLALSLCGHSRKTIAEKLELSEHTVVDYLKQIYKQFGVNSRVQLLSRFIPPQFKEW